MATSQRDQLNRKDDRSNQQSQGGPKDSIREKEKNQQEEDQTFGKTPKMSVTEDDEDENKIEEDEDDVEVEVDMDEEDEEMDDDIEDDDQESTPRKD